MAILRHLSTLKIKKKFFYSFFSVDISTKIFKFTIKGYKKIIIFFHRDTKNRSVFLLGIQISYHIFLGIHVS